MFEVPWKAPVPVREKGQLIDPWVAVPDAAQGIEVALVTVATIVPASVMPFAHVAVKSPLICVPVCDVTFHCALPQLCAVG